MATPSTPTRSSLLAKKAEQAKLRQAKMRVASAWTIAKTMLPKAPAPVQLKLAKSLLANSTPILSAVLRQTAVNSFNTKLAEKFEDVHKTSLNDHLENPSELTREENAVASELKGDPKSASAEKTAQDPGTGKQPENYKDDGRKEPEGMEASKSEVGKIDGLNDDKKLKEATSKKACGADCKGCENCKSEKKEAAAKKAEGEVPEAPVDAPPADAPAAEGEAADAAVDADAAADDTAAAESDAAAEAGDAKGEGDNDEKFDAEIADLQDTKEDLKDDIEQLEEKIDAIVDSADDVQVGESAVADDAAQLDEALSEDAKADADVQDATEGEELDLASIFDDDNMSDKVSSLSGEHTAAEIDEFAGDDFFGPSDAADLEVALDQEESLGSPADLFAIEGDGDALAHLFSSKEASADADIVLPGELEDFFATDLRGDDRDAETDHEGDLLAVAIDSVKQPEQSFATKRDGETKLEEPKQAKVMRKLNPQLGKSASSKKATTQRDVFEALFGEDE